MTIKTGFKRGSLLVASVVVGAAALLAVNVNQASAANVTWDGGGSDNNFSTAANWSGDAVPSNGDVLVFPSNVDADTTEGDDRQLNNDLSNLSVAGIQFTGSYIMSDYDYYTVSGNAITLTGAVSISNGFPILNVGVTLGANVAISGTNTGIEFGESDGAATFNLGVYTLTVAADSSTFLHGAVTGSSNSAINVAQHGTVFLGTANPGFDGALTSAGWVGAQGAGAFGSTTGSTTINQGGAICYGHSTQSTTINEPFTFNAGDNDGYAVFFTSSSCAGQGGGGSLQRTSETTTLAGPITLTTDTLVSTLGTVDVTGTVTGGTFVLSSDSVGVLKLASGVTTAPRLEVVIAADDIEPQYQESVGANRLYIINGERGDVWVENDGILKGTGKVGVLTVEAGGTLAPGLSPGCLSSANLVLEADSNYEFEVGGTTECSGYDQMKVTGTVNVTGSVLKTSLYNGFKPAVGQVYKIIDNDGSDAIIGTFKNLAEGATVTVGGYILKVSYVGGDGNDVTLTVQAVPSVPNTGFTIMRGNPLLIAIAGILAGAVLWTIPRQSRFLRR